MNLIVSINCYLSCLPDPVTNCSEPPFEAISLLGPCSKKNRIGLYLLTLHTFPTLKKNDRNVYETYAHVFQILTVVEYSIRY